MSAFVTAINTDISDTTTLRSTLLSLKSRTVNQELSNICDVRIAECDAKLSALNTKLNLAVGAISCGFDDNETETLLTAI